MSSHFIFIHPFDSPQRQPQEREPQGFRSCLVSVAVLVMGLVGSYATLLATRDPGTGLFIGAIMACFTTAVIIVAITVCGQEDPAVVKAATAAGVGVILLHAAVFWLPLPVAVALLLVVVWAVTAMGDQFGDVYGHSRRPRQRQQIARLARRSGKTWAEVHRAIVVNRALIVALVVALIQGFALLLAAWQVAAPRGRVAAVLIMLALFMLLLWLARCQVKPRRPRKPFRFGRWY